CDEVQGGVSLVVIDPPTNFLADTDEHKNSEVRQLVMRVVEWALGRDLAVVFILHVNKQTGKGVEALNRVMGSVAWVTTARIAHTFCTDPNDPTRALWVPLKNNLGPLGKAVAYRIGNADGAARVEWLEEVDTTADEALGHSAPRERRDVVAAEWLIERFREVHEWESRELFERADQDGVSRNAIFEAKRSLNLPRARQHIKENGDKTFFWWVPENWPPLAAPSQDSDRP
ncbi:MAG TPA: AAA family ATPase, partial [bacterium]|nr:AAA family ATPase [bacterium]